MINKILILIFVLVLTASTVIGQVIFYHFKKFSLTSDAFARRIVRIFAIGTIAFSVLSILFLLLAIL